MTAAVFSAVFLAFGGLAVVSFVLGAGQRWPGTLLFAVVYFLGAGAIIGLQTRQNLVLSAIVASSGILTGLFITVASLGKSGAGGLFTGNPPYLAAGPLLLIAPFLLTLIGGYVGKRIRRSRRHSIY